MEFAKQREYVGDLAQLFELREARLCGGRAEGVRAVLLSDGAGMELMLLPDRCLDLYSLKYRGKNLGYLAPAGVAGPAFYDRHGDNWLKSYGAGFLATCGLSNIGSPCEDAGETLGLHGELANTPAEGLAASIRFDRRMLDHFVQWKMLGKGDYAMGLEPCNATIDGRADARANGSLKFLEPGAQAVHRLTVKVGERL